MGIWIVKLLLSTEGFVFQEPWKPGMACRSSRNGFIRFWIYHLP